MFNFVILVYQLAAEKEKKLKQGMRFMGLQSKVYWLSWLITHLIYCFITTILLIGTHAPPRLQSIEGTTCLLTHSSRCCGARAAGGYACKFAFFWDTNFFVLFFVFYLFSISMVSFAFFISTFVNTSAQADILTLTSVFVHCRGGFFVVARVCFCA